MDPLGVNSERLDGNQMDGDRQRPFQRTYLNTNEIRIVVTEERYGRIGRTPNGVKKKTLRRKENQVGVF